VQQDQLEQTQAEIERQRREIENLQQKREY
jgi:hypothetical protein